MKKMHKGTLVLGVLMLFWATNISAQGPDTLWTRKYGGTSWDIGKSVQQTSDGGYVVAGWTNSFGRREDVYLIKADENGDLLWTGLYGGWNWDQGESVLQTSDDGYLIAGNLACGWDGVCDIYVIRTNEDGDVLWTKSYGGPLGDQTYSLAPTDDGGYLIVGTTRSFGAGENDVYLLRLRADGDTLWTKTFGGVGSDGGYSVLEGHNGEIIVAGWTGGDVYLIKTDADGDTLWTRTYGGSKSDFGCSVQENSDGGHIIAGGTHSFGEDDCDVYLIETDAEGDTLWTRTHGGAGYDVATSIQRTSDGGYIIAGWTDSFGSGNWDVYLIKTDGEGDTLWTQTHGGAEDDWAWSVQQTSDGGYIVAGESGGDVYLIKTAPEVRIEECESLQRAFLVGQCCPNPLIDRTSIRYQIAKSSHVRIAIYNLVGIRVATLVDHHQAAGLHTVTWDGTDNLGRKVSSGSYFLRLEVAHHTATRKLCVVR